MAKRFSSKCVAVPLIGNFKEFLSSINDTKEQYFIIYTSLELIKCNKCLFSDDNCSKGFSSPMLHGSWRSERKRDYLSLARTRFNIIKIAFQLPTWDMKIIIRNNNKRLLSAAPLKEFSFNFIKFALFFGFKLCESQFVAIMPYQATSIRDGLISTLLSLTPRSFTSSTIQLLSAPDALTHVLR